MSSSDEEGDAIIDGDICSSDEIDNFFKSSYNLVSEEAISLKKNYILHLDNSIDFDRIATATSDNTIHIFDLNQQKGLSQLTQLNVDAVNGLIKGDICGIKFAKNNANLIFVSSTVGEIHSFDIRTPDATVQKFECDDAQRKPFTCFDVNSNDTILCAGTEEQLSEAYLIYFDIRKNVTLGAYTDSHKNDVTQVKFHPNKHNLIASGSTDGLINVFDIVQTSEDDALEYCLNTESSVQTINWHTTGTDTENRLTCITDTNDFQLFNVEDSELMLQFDRSAITDSIKRKSAIDCYLVNCHTSINNEIILLAGSNSNRGECLRSLTLCKDQLEARNNFRNNKQIVRCSLFNNKSDTLITAGEGGIISVWEQNKPLSAGTKLKETLKRKDRKAKPY